MANPAPIDTLTAVSNAADSALMYALGIGIVLARLVETLLDRILPRRKNGGVENPELHCGAKIDALTKEIGELRSDLRLVLDRLARNDGGAK